MLSWYSVCVNIIKQSKREKKNAETILGGHGTNSVLVYAYDQTKLCIGNVYIETNLNIVSIEIIDLIIHALDIWYYNWYLFIEVKPYLGS